jgi:hypothetical protein
MKLESADIDTRKENERNNSLINKMEYTYNSLTSNQMEWEWMDR